MTVGPSLGALELKPCTWQPPAARPARWPPPATTAPCGGRQTRLLESCPSCPLQTTARVAFSPPALPVGLRSVASALFSVETAAALLLWRALAGPWTPWSMLYWAKNSVAALLARRPSPTGGPNGLPNLTRCAARALVLPINCVFRCCFVALLPCCLLAKHRRVDPSLPSHTSLTASSITHRWPQPERRPANLLAHHS